MHARAGSLLLALLVAAVAAPAGARPVQTDLSQENARLRADLEAYRTAYDDLTDGLARVDRYADRIRDRRATQKLHRMIDDTLSRAQDDVGSYDDTPRTDDRDHDRDHHAATDAEVAQIVAHIKSASFADDQLAVVKQVTGSWFTVAQIVQLMKACTFEDTRVEVAVALHAHVIDGQSWYQVSDGFTFASSADALRQRLGQ
jgi:hypothetical protein